jgi:hypothetical protein
MICEFIFIGKDDDYDSNYINKTNFCLLYNLKNIHDAGLDKNFKFTFVDWGSKNKLSDILNLGQYSNLVRFIHIPRNVIKKNNLPLTYIPVSLAPNIGIRRSKADYIFVGSSDQMIDINSWQRLFNSLKIELNFNRISLIHRKRIPLSCLKENVDNELIDKIICNLTIVRDEIFIRGGGAAFIGASKVFWNKIKGLNENFISYGGNDEELLHFTKSYSSPSFLSNINGIYAFKLPYFSSSKRKKNIKSSKYDWKNFGDRDDGWGLFAETFKFSYGKKINKDNNKLDLNIKDKNFSFTTYILSTITSLSKGDRLINLFLLFSEIKKNNNKNFILDGNYSLMELLIFPFIHRDSNIILISDSSNIENIRIFLSKVEFFLKPLKIHPYFFGNIYVKKNDSEFTNIDFFKNNSKFQYLKKNQLNNDLNISSLFLNDKVLKDFLFYNKTLKGFKNLLSFYTPSAVTKSINNFIINFFYLIKYIFGKF